MGGPGTWESIREQENAGPGEHLGNIHLTNPNHKSAKGTINEN